MNALLTFVIPVRHQDNARDWGALRARLAQTVRSVEGQQAGDWRGVIVANEGADLPPLGARWSVARVSFPPNQLHEQGGADREAFHDAVRLDKGRRILTGMLHDRATDYYMVVDDDDFVSNRLVDFVGENRGAPGWDFHAGYVWAGGSLLYRHPAFSTFCGTSHIVRADLLDLPDRFEDASPDYIKNMLGSHIFISGELVRRGTPLGSLPFPGAVYRIAHGGSHSRSKGLVRTVFANRRVLTRPLELVRRIGRMSSAGTAMRREFAMPDDLVNIA